MDHESWVSRAADGAKWLALTLAFRITMWAGAFLLLTPFMHVARPDFDLAAQKLATTFGGTAVMAVVGLSLVLAGAALRQLAFRLQQVKNDRVASRILRDLRVNPEAPVPAFYLYLRAFETTGRLHVPLLLRLRKLSIGMGSLATNDVESHVSGAIRRVGPLIALGHPGEAFGAGRVDTDEASWQADIRALMARARGILLVPSHRPGTMWEIETLKREGWLAKSIFVMPPRAAGELDTRQRWEAARQALAIHGLDAPEHQNGGLLFEVGSDGRVTNVEPLLLNSVRQMRKSLERLLSEAPPAGGLFKTIARAERRGRRATRWGWAETVRQLSPYGLAVVGLFLGHPAVGFNADESWPTVLNRTMSGFTLSEREGLDEIALTNSERYQALAANADDVGTLKSQLLLRGLVRLSDEERRDYFTAMGGMVAALDTGGCAAVARGEVSGPAMRIALTYMPWTSVEPFLNVQTAAIRAAADDAPTPPFDDTVGEEAAERFLAQLGASGQQRFLLEDTPDKHVSDDDACWRLRETYRAVTSLPEPYGNAWAQRLAAGMSGGEPTAQQVEPSPPAPPAVPENASRDSVRPSLPETVARADTPPDPRPTIELDQPTQRVEGPPDAPYVPPSPPPIAGPSYTRLLEDATTAIGAMHVSEARDLVEQMIRLDAARSEAWALRGVLAMNVYGDLPVAYQSYENALSRGGKATFRLVHDHGPDRPPCFGSLEIRTADVEFRSDDGSHRFQWRLDTIREAAINGIYGSALGMFHIKAQTANSGDTFNFLATRATDQQIVNRRADAAMMLRLLNQQRASATGCCDRNQR